MLHGVKPMRYMLPFSILNYSRPKRVDYEGDFRVF